MAVVMLALNGEGLGHLIRSTLVAKALASAGEHPIIFSQGRYQSNESARFPSRQVPSLWTAPKNIRRQTAAALAEMAGISLPAVLVEDTHPNPIELPAEIRRVLLVRPTSFEYLLHLNEKYGPLYSAYLLCDAPGSPTWPYDESQTREIATWKTWHIIGPIYRTPSEDDVREVRTRYHLAEDEQLCVFTMGGGGVQKDGAEDVLRFLKLASEVADVQATDSKTRRLFVKGPYFSPAAQIPPRFEVVEDEQQMPALLKIARGAVIRAGFNTTWECIAAGTPFIPLVGTTFEEPAQKRINEMTASGLIPQSPASFWLDDDWRSQFRRMAENISAKYTGAPEPGALQRLIVDQQPSASRPRLQTRASTITAPAADQPIPLTIRVDDVVSGEPALCWLLELLALRRLRASLEVIPYLLDFDEQFLDSYDASNTLFETSQHGYAHVPHGNDDGRYEFDPRRPEASSQELDVIARGKRKMETAFPRRFAGGFSAPYDAVPAWLPQAWQSLGGRYISRVDGSPRLPSTLPSVPAGVPVWSTARGQMLSRGQLQRKLSSQLAAQGYAGIVVQVRHLRESFGRSSLTELVNSLEESGFVSVSLRDRALCTVEPANPRPPAWRDRLTGWIKKGAE